VRVATTHQDKSLGHWFLSFRNTSSADSVIDDDKASDLLHITDAIGRWLRREHQVAQQRRDVVALAYLFAHPQRMPLHPGERGIYPQ